MPVVVDSTRCPCSTPCFPAKMCPHDVLHFDFNEPKKPATLNPELCGDCRGICTNFCDPQALQFARTMDELRLTEATLLGTMTTEEINAERERIKNQAEQQKQQQAAVQEVTTEGFEQEVLRAKLPVVVDFWAPWCGPCKSFAPTFSQVAQEYSGRVKFCKINTDAEPSIAQALRIQSIPTLIVFFQGQVLGSVPGAMQATQLRSTIEQVLQAVGGAAGAAAESPAAPSPVDEMLQPSQAQPKEKKIIS